MKAWKLPLSFSVLILLSGCVHLFVKHTEGVVGDPLRADPRVLFRDLTQPYHRLKHPMRTYRVLVSRHRLDAHHGFITQIAFANERAMPVKGSLFLNLIKNGLKTKGTRVLLVGHSHGPSQIGNAKLALSRTTHIAKLLMHAGVSPHRIIQAATWSAESAKGYSKAVRVYIVPDKLKWLAFQGA